VAGVMISTDSTLTGVTGANGSLAAADLFASAAAGAGGIEEQSAASAQFIATRDFGLVSAINLSFTVGTSATVLDGKSLFTEFVDWSALHHDVLYVAASRDLGTDPGVSSPIDNYNGITIAASSPDISGKYRLVTNDVNDYSENQYSIFNRTFIDLVAPGVQVSVQGPASNPAPIANGSSIAAPLVTGTVALLQQYGDERRLAGAPGWALPDYARHEVMKAVLLNSADKIKDDHTRTENGIRVPQGGFLGMDRTVLDKTVNPAGTDWLQSDAYLDNTTDGLTPLDAHMGAGELDAKRAVTQFKTGEQHVAGTTGTVPVIGWDYGGHPGLNQARKYQFGQSLEAGSFVSITLCFDRHVTLQYGWRCSWGI
jgi:hypothetical protein